MYIQNLKEFDTDRNIRRPRILRTRVGPNNRARTGSGGGIKVATDYAWNDDDYPLYIENCEIMGNHAVASNGGGLFVYANGSQIQTGIKLTMANVIIGGNTASGYGGGMDVGGILTLEASNLTFMYNTAGTGSGNPGSAINLHFLDYDQDPSKISNSILWYDSSPPSQNQIRLESTDSNGYLEIWYGDAQTAAPAGVTYYNTFNQNPLFVDPDGQDDIKGTADDDYRLALGSPCIDAGNKWLLPADELDLDDDGDETEPLPRDLREGGRTLGITSFPNTEVDMGAYEFTGTIQSANPPSGKIDARQPHPTSTNSLEARQGFGRRFNNQYGAPEPIAVTLDPPTSGADEMYLWGFAESGQEMTEQGPLGPNSIYSVTEVANPPGTYQILLDRPISGGYVTTITYNGSGGSVFYGCLPGDANADCTSAPPDILAIIDYVNGLPTPPRLYSPDIDRSNALGPPDILRVIDLLNGAGTYIPWLNVKLAPNICQPGGEKLTAGGDKQGVAQETTLNNAPADEGNAEFIDGFVTYVSTTVIADAEGEQWFKVIVEALTDFSVEHQSPAERRALADELQDPSLTFESAVAADMVPEIVESLLK